MSQLITLRARYSSVISPTRLLSQLLESGFVQFMQPKVGALNFDGNQLAFGVQTEYRGTDLMVGESIVMPGLTTLANLSDGTAAIRRFLIDFPKPKRYAAQMWGDTRLAFRRNDTLAEGKFARWGSPPHYWPILVFGLDNSARIPNTTVMWSMPSPAPFLKDWGSATDIPSPFTADAAEQNWFSVIWHFHNLIQLGGISHLEHCNLHLEGSVVGKQKDSLITVASILPKLELEIV